MKSKEFARIEKYRFIKKLFSSSVGVLSNKGRYQIYLRNHRYELVFITENKHWVIEKYKHAAMVPNFDEQVVSHRSWRQALRQLAALQLISGD